MSKLVYVLSSFALGFYTNHALRGSKASVEGSQSRVTSAAGWTEQLNKENDEKAITEPTISISPDIKRCETVVPDQNQKHGERECGPSVMSVPGDPKELERLVPNEGEIKEFIRHIPSHLQYDDKVENPDGTLSEYGRTPSGGTTGRTLGPDGKPVSDFMREAEGTSIDRTYYPDGRLRGVIYKDADGHEASAGFSASGHFTYRSQELQDGRKLVFGYGEDGEVIAKWLDSSDGRWSYKLN